ncbi:hypothetical protein [Nocardia alba]|nr:hypothetical protein [Nocardia alba]
MLSQLTGGSGSSGSSGASGASGPLGLLDHLGASGALDDIRPAALGSGGGGGGGLPSGIGGGIDDKLFPRASPVTTSAEQTRAGIATGTSLTNAGMPMGMGGYPMGGGMGGGMGGQGQQQQQERKRAAYLDSTEHLDEAIGEDPLSIRPIIDR